MSLGEIVAGVSGLKTVLDTLRGLKDINDASVRNAVAIELQGKIPAAYQDQLALIEKVSTLEKEVASLKNWDAEKQRYELSDVGQGCLAYTLKEGMQPAEAHHSICANCYAQGKKRFLQKEQKHVGRGTTLSCHDCGSELYIWGQYIPDGTGKKR